MTEFELSLESNEYELELTDTRSYDVELGFSFIPSIGALDDVDITGVADGQTIVWNTSTSQFEPGSAGADLGTSVLDDLGNVNTGSVVDGEALVYDGGTSQWISGSAGADLSTSSVGDLSDVDLTLLEDGDILQNNNGNFEPVPLPTVSHIELNSTIVKDLNIDGTFIEFDVNNSQSGDAFSHSTINSPEEVTVNTDGVYSIAFNISFESASQRVHPRFDLLVNGVSKWDVLHTYIRARSGHNESSANGFGHLNLSAGDVIEIQTSSSTGDSVNSFANRQFFSAQYIGIPATNSDLTDINSVTADYTVAQSDNNNLIEANGNITITGDGSVSSGTRVQVVNTGVGTITFQATGTLNGVGTQITDQWDSVEFYHNGFGNWTVLGPLV